ncbi:ras association domain-containing protein 7 isoform X1 [Hylobates moloch]|uniref:ras association domain-containing protein 7 isoform X1 n=2 Tax=Hylobates moloch TaxID=81572 RepID=UPI0013644D99|nr:ras association domain-containing protein 7 isoform X1 [Hylobates moloch]
MRAPEGRHPRNVWPAGGAGTGGWGPCGGAAAQPFLGQARRMRRGGPGCHRGRQVLTLCLRPPHRTGMLLGLAAMELKVWVDGIQRVVCGVSEQTTCQEVVIALAQAIGQTGRFVLVQRLREKERQLLPEECPVGAQATCGQFASDVQFVLRRTGPSLAGRPSSDSCPPPERCPIRASLPAKPRAALGCEPRKTPTPGPASSLSPPGPVAPVTPTPGCCTDLRGLELRVQRNAEELGHEAFWEQELRREQAREREGQARLQALSAATAEHAARLQALDAQARALEAELQLAAEAPGPPSPMASATERLRNDLAIQERQSAEVQGSLALVSRALEAAERALQAQAQELEELNRELRQCNLQQFIQQTGAALPPPPRPDRGPPGTQGPLPPAREESLLGTPPESHAGAQPRPRGYVCAPHPPGAPGPPVAAATSACVLPQWPP